MVSNSVCSCGAEAVLGCVRRAVQVYGVLKKMKMVWRVAGPYHVHSRTTAHTLQPEEQAVRRKWSFFTSPRMRRDQPPLAAPPGQPSSPVAHRAVTIGLQVCGVAVRSSLPASQSARARPLRK